MKSSSYHLSLLFISSALLSLEISLMRMLKIEGFGNFTYGAIALALTGFGASGTLISLFRRRVDGKELRLSLWSSVLFIFFLGLSFFGSRVIEFDALRILWDINQVLHLLIRYLFYTLTFMAGSAFVVLSFLIGKPGRVYFFNLTGSSTGIVTILACLYFIPPKHMLIIPLLFALLSTAFMYTSVRPIGRIEIAALPVIAAGIALLSLGDLRILPFKGRELALNLPDARILTEHISPFGSIEVISSSMIRIAPGLSYSFEEELPRQHGLYLDGDLLSSIDRIDDDASMDYLLYQTQSTVYQLHDGPEAFVIGLGGGGPVERAFRGGAKKILVTEENPHIVRLLEEEYASFTGDLFNSDAVTTSVGGGRIVLRGSGKKWDIIDISENILVSSIGGIYATDTYYTLTVQAFVEYLNALKPDGTVSATVPLKQPPRNLPKLVSIAVQALETQSLAPESHIIVVRSWSSGTVLLKKRAFSAGEIEAVRRFCEMMRFDFVFYPGMGENDANRYNIVQDSVYYRTVMPVVRKYPSFMKGYIFNIRPATDEKPYFFYFFRIGKLARLFRETGKKWLLVVEGGYIVLFATFTATLILAAIFILLPLLFWKRVPGGRLSVRLSVLLYFSMIALAFMFVEILLMQKFRQYVSNPLYSNSLIIATLLISSGISSFLTDRIVQRRTAALLLTLIALTIYLSLLLLAFEHFFPLLRSPGLILPVIFTTPLGLCMGVFFPLGMSGLKTRNPSALPWAWSVNGFFSVIASTGTVLIASNAGLLTTGIAAVLCYWTALIFFPR
jgi:hypothetical protein